MIEENICQTCKEKLDEEETENGLHKCPYQEDVNNDSDFKCNCCFKCQSDCVDNI